MKTNANVSTTKRQTSNELATLRKVSVNPAMLHLMDMRKQPENGLIIQGYTMREWLEHLTDCNGLYFLDLSNMDRNNYSLHYKHHVSGKLMELDCQETFKEAADLKKETLEAMLFDLSLFPGEPILTFDSDKTQSILRNLSAIYTEHRREVECIIGRLVNIDLKKVFETGIYQDSRIREISVDGIYHALYSGTSRTFIKEQASYGMYLIFAAVRSIFYQVIGKKVLA